MLRLQAEVRSVEGVSLPPLQPAELTARILPGHSAIRGRASRGTWDWLALHPLAHSRWITTAIQREHGYGGDERFLPEKGGRAGRGRHAALPNSQRSNTPSQSGSIPDRDGVLRYFCLGLFRDDSDPRGGQSSSFRESSTALIWSSRAMAAFSSSIGLTPMFTVRTSSISPSSSVTGAMK